jgi:hypothetical protein
MAATVNDTSATEQTDLADVIAKVKKILAKANGKGTTEAEAETAMGIAQKLMTEHNLSMAQVEAGGSSSAAPVARQRVQHRGKAMYKYQYHLAANVAEANFCFYFQSVSHKRNKAGRYQKVKAHVFVGREANVVAAQLMYDYLRERIEALVLPALGLANAQRLSSAAMLWREGCSDRLCRRLYDRRMEAIREQERAAREATERAAAAGQPVGTAIVLASNYIQAERDANVEHAYGYQPGTLARLRAERAAAPPQPVPEVSPEEQARRDRQYKRDQARWKREAEKERERREYPAYDAGYAAGGYIGLDAQIPEEEGEEQPALEDRSDA